jgi:hypothetical protein
MPRSSNRGRNNNPSGRNQYSDWGVTELVRERPIAAAAVAAGAAAAGLFLWSKRTQISDQLSSLSDQFSEWREGTATDDTGGFATSGQTSAQQRGMSPTGGGNSSLGRASGGGGTRSTASGRGRVKPARTSEMA